MFIIHPVTHSFKYVFSFHYFTSPSLPGGLGASLGELDHHHGDVVWTAAGKRLQDDALRTEVRLIQMLFNEMHGLLVAEGVPESI